MADARTIFLYWRWRRATSIRTLIVLSGFAETTTPWRVFGRPGPCSRGSGAGAGGRSARAARAFSRRLARQRRRCSAFRLRRSIRLHAHDEAESAKPGDVVRLVETRPLSRTKRWRVAEIVEVAK